MLYQNEQIIKDEKYRQYLNYFCQRYDSYAIQSLPKIKKVKGQYGKYEEVEEFREWRTALNKDKSYKQLNDNVIYNGHLMKKYWGGIKAGECLSFGLSDIDIEDKLEQQKAIEYIVNKLQVNQNQFLYLYPCTSPRGRLHLLFKVQYKGYPVHYSLFRKKLRDAVKPFELYPDYWNYMRLPFGYKQTTLIYNDLAETLTPKHNLTWQEQLYYFDKLEPIELSTLPFVNEVSDKKDKAIAKKVELTSLSVGKELFENGLQMANSRHDSQLQVLIYLYRLNCNMQQAIFLTQRWIKEKHNGYSKQINRGKWDFVYKDIEGQGKWIEEHLIITRQFPDHIHNNYEGYCCIDDLLLNREITQSLLNGSILKNENPYIVASRVHKLIEYVRPRQHYEFVYMPRWCWQAINGDGTAGQSYNSEGKSYIAFRNALKEQGIIHHNDNYKVGSYSESIKFLPKLKAIDDEKEMIHYDFRSEHEYGRAVLRAFPNMNYKEFMDFTGAKSYKTYYNAKASMNLIF
jgi:hypothetical protein